MIHKLLFITGAALVMLMFSRCNEPRCNDGRRNGGEEAIDCGGDCPPCYTCDDGFKNQAETLTDCGGEHCDFCPNEWEPLLYNSPVGYAGLFGVDESRIWAVGSRNIGQSTDGGKTWANQEITALPANSGLFSIHFFDAQRGVALGSGYNGFGFIGISLTTNDGGQNWQYQSDAGFNQVGTVTYRLPATVFVYDGFDIRVSYDGGVHFQAFNAPGVNDQYTPRFVYYSSPTEGILLAYRYQQINSANVDTYLYRTTDGGNTWSFYGSAGNIGLQKFQMFSPKLAIAPVTNESYWRITADGGLTWRNFSPPRNGKMLFTDENNGYLIGDGQVDDLYYSHRTTDGGATWEPYGIYNTKRLANYEYVIFTNNLALYQVGQQLFAVNGGLMRLDWQ